MTCAKLRPSWNGTRPNGEWPYWTRPSRWWPEHWLYSKFLRTRYCSSRSRQQEPAGSRWCSPLRHSGSRQRCPQPRQSSTRGGLLPLCCSCSGVHRHSKWVYSRQWRPGCLRWAAVADWPAAWTPNRCASCRHRFVLPVCLNRECRPGVVDCAAR
jgi:hypothetical protein